MQQAPHAVDPPFTRIIVLLRTGDEPQPNACSAKLMALQRNYWTAGSAPIQCSSTKPYPSYFSTRTCGAQLRCRQPSCCCSPSISHVYSRGAHHSV